MRLAWRLAWRDLRGGITGARTVLMCLAIGVAAMAAISGVRSGLNERLTSQAAILLGGDAEMEFTYRFATPPEREWIDANARGVSRVVDFRSLAQTDQERALTRIKAVDDAYPLLGEVDVEGTDLRAALAPRDGIPGAVMERALALRLGLKQGDRLTLAERDFYLGGILISAPDDAAGGLSFAPRTIIAAGGVGETFWREGTLFSSHYRMLRPEGATLDTWQASAQTALPDAGFRWRDSRNATRGIERFVNRLGSFLVLVGLSALIVGGIGIAASLDAYIQSRVRTIATLRSLGASRRLVSGIYMIQVALLCVVGIAIGLGAGAVLIAIAKPLIAAQMPFAKGMSVGIAPFAEAAFYGALVALGFALWPLGRLSSINPAALYRGANARGISWRAGVLSFASFALMVVVAALLSGLWKLTLAVLGGICGGLILLILAARLVQRAARIGAPLARRHPPTRWALSGMAAARGELVSVMAAVGLALTVLSALGQIDGNLRRAIVGSLPEVAPAFFFIDIPPDEIDSFAALARETGARKIATAPMLRGNITQINGRDATEVAGPHWVLRGDRGVTYSETPDAPIIDGDWWPADYDGPPLASFAAEEAAEMGIGIGDRLTINILGRPIEVEIANLREVDFSTANIGFILSLSPNTLRGAPHTFIATIHADIDDEGPLLRTLTDRFSGVTPISVRDAVERVSGIMEGIANAARTASLVALVVGLTVLFGAAAASEAGRRREAAILRALGATRAQVRNSFLIRLALMGLASALIALVLGCLAAWGVMRFVMEDTFVPIWSQAALTLSLGVLSCLAASALFVRRPLRSRPTEVLRAG